MICIPESGLYPWVYLMRGFEQAHGVYMVMAAVILVSEHYVTVVLCLQA